MREGDVVTFLVASKGAMNWICPEARAEDAALKQGMHLWYHDARCTEVIAAKGNGGKRFALEFIAGPMDGERLRFTRAELDAIMGREGGEEWK